MSTRRAVTLLFALLAVGLALASARAAEPASDPRAEVERARNLLRAITDYHVLLQGEGATRDVIAAVLFDVDRYAEQLDDRLGTSRLLLRDPQALEELADIVARAHLQCAILHARGVDLESSIRHYERVAELLGYDPADWETTVERRARPGRLPRAAEVAYEMASPRDVAEDLKHFWSAGVIARFVLREHTPAQRSNLRLERFGGANDPFSGAAYTLGAARFAARATEGLDEFRVVLPPGHYRVVSVDKSAAPVEFHLPAGSYPDPVVLNPNTFSFAFASADEKCRPTLTLNGIPVRALESLPYGAYRVAAPPTFVRRLPDKITVDQGDEVTLRMEPERLDAAREGEPIFLYVTTPPGSVYTLRM